MTPERLCLVLVLLPVVAYGQDSPVQRDRSVPRPVDAVWNAVREWMVAQPAVVNAFAPAHHLVSMTRRLAPQEAETSVIDGTDLPVHLPLVAHIAVWTRQEAPGSTRVRARAVIESGGVAFRFSGQIENAALDAIEMLTAADVRLGEPPASLHWDRIEQAFRAASWMINLSRPDAGLLTVTSRIASDTVRHYTSDSPRRYQPGSAHVTVFVRDGKVTVRSLLVQPGSDPPTILASNGRIEAAATRAVNGNPADFPVSIDYPRNNPFWWSLFTPRGNASARNGRAARYVLPAAADQVWTALLTVVTQSRVIQHVSSNPASLTYISSHPTRGRSDANIHRPSAATLTVHLASFVPVFLLPFRRWNVQGPWNPAFDAVEQWLDFLPRGWPEVVLGLMIWGAAGVAVAAVRRVVNHR